MILPALNTLKNDYDALIMDLDGTLIDSMHIWHKVDEDFLSKRGIPLTPEYTDYVKRANFYDGAVYTINKYNLPETPEEVMDEWNSMVNVAYANDIRLKPGVYEFLKEASELGYKIGVATASTSANTRNCLTNNKIINLLDAIITLEDLDGNVDKSTPDIYLKMASLLDVTPDRALVFEDVLGPCKGAMSGGFDVCAIYDEVGCGAEWEEFKSTAKFNLPDWEYRK